MGRKKILWLCSWYPGHAEPFNGDFVQRHARSAALFHDIHVIHVFADPSGKISHPKYTIKKEVGLVEEIYEFPKRKDPVSRIFSHLRVLATYRRLIKAYIRSEGVPDLVHVHVPVWAGVTALWIKKKYGIPYVITEHWGIYNRQVPDHFYTKSIFFRKAIKKIYDQAEKLISVSFFIARQMNEMFGRKPFSIIHNAVDTSLFYFKGTTLNNSFLHVSNTTPEKNTEGILRAFNSVINNEYNARLDLVGKISDPVKAVLEGLPAILPYVKVHGEVPYRDVAIQMQGAGYLILFSNMENSPCVIGEALCCGIPVIATNTGGIPELVDESNAVLINPGDEIALADAMISILEKKIKFDPKIISAKASTEFSFENIGKKFSDEYENLLKGLSS